MGYSGAIDASLRDDREGWPIAPIKTGFPPIYQIGGSGTLG